MKIDTDVCSMKTDKTSTFNIYIDTETDFSYDGGHSFEDITLCANLSKEEAMDLVEELNDFIGE